MSGSCATLTLPSRHSCVFPASANPSPREAGSYQGRMGFINLNMEAGVLVATEVLLELGCFNGRS